MNNDNNGLKFIISFKSIKNLKINSIHFFKRFTPT